MKTALIIIAFIFVYLLVGALIYIPFVWIMYKLAYHSIAELRYDDDFRWYFLALWPLIIGFLLLFGIAYFPFWLTRKFSEKIFK